MKSKIYRLFVFSLFTLIAVSPAFSKSNGSEKTETFEVGKGEFLLNGEPFVIRAAELHYPRIPREYWDHRIKMSKALGMNTICLYVFWNIHEQNEGEFDFSGNSDLRKFIELCAENDMKVILRPGPYVCAEWEMGGLPWWLLKKKDIRLREDDPYFLEKVEAFQKAVAGQVADLTIQNGGPVIMVQVENEYGSYGEDKVYIGKIRDILKKYFGDETVMFQCDWNSNFTLNGLDDLLWTMNFGTGADIDSQFAELKRLRPDSPLMCSEFWSGWFDKWGAAHETRPAADMIAGIDEMLAKGISFSLYMTHGGTNWAHWAGANSPGYSPDVTSYDYDAPISESGKPTDKYFMLRETISKYLPDGETLPDVPQSVEPVAIEKFELSEYAPLFDNLPEPIERQPLKTIEDYDMGFGSVIYSTVLPGLSKGDRIIVEEPHDFAQLFIDGLPVGTLDRREGERELEIEETIAPGARLDILVEAMGRINFGRAIKDYKGITDRVLVVRANGKDTVELSDWGVYLLPDEQEFYQSMKFQPIPEDWMSLDSRLPRGVYKGKFYVEKPSDTFLNFETWGKGLVYVNGHGIGRIWNIGPQQTLYMPGPWLREGENEILIFDILGPDQPVVEGLVSPVIDILNQPSATDRKESDADLSGFIEAASGSFDAGSGWKEFRFGDGVKAAKICLEIQSTHAGDLPAVAEIYLLDADGWRIGRENWKVTASSEQKGTGNHTADKVIDLQESTYWTPEEGTAAPYEIIIDLGVPGVITGLQYLPRMESGAPGAVKDFSVKVLSNP